MQRRPPASYGLLGLLLFSTHALAEAPNRHEFTLDNGLQVIVAQDQRAPVVTTQMLIKVGSSHEPPGQSGLSHALEHLLFRGSAKTAPGDFSKIVERLGGTDNALTNRDFTLYHQTLPSDRLAVALELNADLLKNARLSSSEFEREIEAVKAERRENIDHSPRARLSEQLQAIGFQSSSYHTPVIGWMGDLERMTNDELKGWYQQWYAPNNAILIVVGDVQPDVVQQQVEHYFAAFPRQSLPATKPPLQSSATGPRQVTVYDALNTPMLFMSFNVPTYATAKDSADVDALRLIQAMLGAGRSARLRTQLAHDQRVLSNPIVSYAPLARGDTLFDLSASVNPTQAKPLPELQQAIWGQLEALKQTPPDPAELNRARALLLADRVFNQDHLEGQAAEIAAALGSGLPASQLDNDASNLARVTPEHIQQTARAYFTPERMVIAYLQAKEANDD
ncbi:pitrilysin family protein [Pseudomonas sp. H9]|uniref:M16 family metallopeptidase n=1 Tax=Pseudomonas sp. H9 TaxID=483968 RepID=UPI001057FAE3|nr:pitrilysin family protein [Pseudomonas sp. H9]TDF83500.1 insulinase family protein [Pseudomonas sp. H9]